MSIGRRSLAALVPPGLPAGAALFVAIPGISSHLCSPGADPFEERQPPGGHAQDLPPLLTFQGRSSGSNAKDGAGGDWDGLRLSTCRTPALHGLTPAC